MNTFLVVGASLSAVAALLHIGIIVFGASWYRFFGAGEKMASLVEQGSFFPHMVTFVIATLLALSSAYALSGAGLLPTMPLMKLALVAVTGVYSIRGLAGFWFVLNPTPAYSISFALWSSLICLTIGVIHFFGLMKIW